MSNLGVAYNLKRSEAQLPVSSYFDNQWWEAEKRLLFDVAPGYVGHELMVPQTGDYHTVPWLNHGQALVRNAAGVELISNVCRHRQAQMLEGRGNTHNIVCPLHRWTYDLKGELLGAPHFEGKPCLNLDRTALQSWNGLQFAAPKRAGGSLVSVAQELAQLGVARELDFTGYQLDRVHVHECDYNWKSFIEVYLEDYHVGPFHPGLGSFVTCDDLRWEFGRYHSVQTVGVNNALAQAGTPTYQAWHKALMQFRNGEPPEHGAIWLTLYPNVMVEWYPHVLVVSTLHPHGPRKTTNVVEFYYPEEIMLFEREFIAAQQAAYMETCVEDDEIAIRMDRGRESLMKRGINQVGPYQSPMEDGMQHFHEYLRAHLGEAVRFDEALNLEGA
jgi:choline monooxygenase